MKSITAEFHAREATFPSRAETATNSDTTHPLHTFHAIESNVREITHKKKQGQNPTAETLEDGVNLVSGSDEFKTPVISLVSEPPDKNLVTSKPRNFSGEVNTIAVLYNVDNLSRPQSKFISEPCQSSREFSMSDDVVQTTNKENEIQCYSCSRKRNYFRC